MDHIEIKVDRIDAFEEKQKLENKSFTEALKGKISKNQFDKLAMRMNHIIDQGKNQFLMTDLYNKRLNLLINGFKNSNAWET